MTSSPMTRTVMRSCCPPPHSRGGGSLIRLTPWRIRRLFSSCGSSCGAAHARSDQRGGGSAEAGDATTPVIASQVLSERTGEQVWLKCENLQRTGSFKPRGAYNRIANLSIEDRARGVVAASAGNHAQGVAWAATEL